jgi:hypothetical protein
VCQSKPCTCTARWCVLSYCIMYCTALHSLVLLCKVMTDGILSRVSNIDSNMFRPTGFIEAKLAGNCTRNDGTFVAISGRSMHICLMVGVDQWAMFATGAPSARTEVLLDLQATATWGTPTNVPGSGALRQGKWKLLHGHTAVWKKPNATAAMCTMRDGSSCLSAPKTCTLNHTPETSPAWCPNGW